MKDLKIKFRWETEFKETEIGEIPKEWEVYPLSEVVKEAIVGSTPLKKISKYWANGTIPWLTNKEVEYGKINYIEDTEEKVNVIALEETNLRLVPPNSLIISFTASVGKVVINKVPITTNQQFISFVLKSIPDTVKYLGYFFLLNRELIESFSGATPFSFITKEKALQIPIIFPPLPEQSRIATVLSWFDDLIEVKKRQNEILEKTAMAIFKSWFIDFEPFRDGEFAYSEELGKEIPKGWEVNPIEKEFYLIKGRKYEVFDDYFEGCSPYLLIETFKTGKIEFWTIEKEPQVEESDVVLVADGESSGKVLRYQKGILGSTLLTLKPKSENSIELKHLIYLTLKFYEDEIMSHRTGSAIPHLDKDFLKSFLLLLPPSHILQSFHSLVEPLFQKIILNQKQIMTLRKIRDTLLPLLIFGKLRVEEV